MPSLKSEYKDYCTRIANNDTPTDKETNDLKLRLYSGVRTLANRIITTENSRKYSKYHFYYDPINNMRCEELDTDGIKFYDSHSIYDIHHSPEGERKHLFFSQMTIAELHKIYEFLDCVVARNYND